MRRRCPAGSGTVASAPGDPHDWKGWYRSQLLRDDHAIDTIWRKLRDVAKRLPGRGTDARDAVAAALSYIRHRKSKMRYAAHYAANLPIGSGATESTCWQMQTTGQAPGPIMGQAGFARRPRNARAGALGPLVSRLAALRSNASPRRARGCMIRIASALAADSSAFHARPALLGCESHRRVSELGGDVCGKADPVLSRHAERTCEVASGRSGSSSCRSVLLPG